VNRNNSNNNILIIEKKNNKINRWLDSICRTDIKIVMMKVNGYQGITR